MSAWIVQVTDYQESDIDHYGPFRTQKSAEKFAASVRTRAGRLWNKWEPENDQTEPNVCLIYLNRPNVTRATAPWDF